MTELNDLQKMITELQGTSSVLDKKDILAKYPQCKELLWWTYNPFKNFYVTSDNILKQRKSLLMSGPNLLGASVASSQRGAVVFPDTLVKLLEILNAREVTGLNAIRSIIAFLKKNYQYEDVILKILDRDLQCRIDAKLINKVWPAHIPAFNVALANSYWDCEDSVDFVKDKWFASRKMDGLRLLTVIDNDGKISCFSRNGKEFTSLDRIKEEIRELWPDLVNTVFDGELCIVDEDGAEHFDQIIRLATKKDFTVPFPKYRIFDVLGPEEFGSGESIPELSVRLMRWDTLAKKAPRKSTMIVRLEQTPIKDRAHLDKLFAEATDAGWEGLIIRKDVPYKGKRSNDLLKVKSFYSEEVKVLDIVSGPLRFLENGKEVTEVMLSAVTVDYQGNKVSVGSGFTKEQRKYWHANPRELIGQFITINYFEVTHNQEGGTSLRFPTFVCVRDYE